MYMHAHMSHKNNKIILFECEMSLLEVVHDSLRGINRLYAECDVIARKHEIPVKLA